MIITERERIELVKRLEEAMGENAAATLMEYLPANGWRDVATVTDLDNLRLTFTNDLDSLRTELKQDMADLRGELKQDMADLRSELKQEMSDLRGEVRQEIAGVRVELADTRATFSADLSKLATKMTVTLIGSLTGFGGLLIAAAAIFKP